jgi:hypothetical protein
VADIDWRANPPYNYWSYLRSTPAWCPWWYAPWLAWQRYQAMLDDLERHRREHYDSCTLGAWWMDD